MKEFVLFASIICASASVSAQDTINVSPQGCDATANGTTAKPYCTIEAAIKKAACIYDADTVFVEVAPGEYQLSKPIEITYCPKSPVVVRCSSEQGAVMNGGVKISGWKQGDDGLWFAEVDATKMYGFKFEQMYVNGRRAIRARTPDNEWFVVKDSKEDVHYYGNGRAPEYATQKIIVNPDDLSTLKNIDANQMQNVMTMFYHKWDNTRRYLSRVVADSGFVYLNGGGMKPWNQITTGSRYVLENYKEAISMPGEWWLDVDNAMVYYMPREGEDMRSAEVVAPAVSTLLNIHGSKEDPIIDITFRNIDFHYSSYVMPKWGNDAEQAAASIPAAIHLDYAKNICFDNCSVMHTGNYAMWFKTACSDCNVKHTLLRDLGAGGVKIGDYNVPADTTDVTQRVTIENSIIQQTGMVLPCGVGVAIFHSSYNKVLHNEISNLRYSGVSVGWVWGYTPSLAHHNEVAYNHIHHVGWGELSDMGAVYTLGISPGTRIHNNVIHDVYSYDYGGWGLYTDEGSTGVVMENNLVYACKSGAFHQHYGKDNIIRNNILAFGQYQTLQFTRVEGHRSFTFCNNIVLSDCGKIMSGAWDKAKIDYISNMYWDYRTTKPELLGNTFAEWSKTHEKKSILADPMFRDAKNGDFRFASKKNIKKIGFVPFDYSTAGVYGSDEWKARAEMSKDDIERFNQIIISREKECSSYYKK